jgi:hypothetical protein
MPFLYLTNINVKKIYRLAWFPYTGTPSDEKMAKLLLRAVTLHEWCTEGSYAQVSDANLKGGLSYIKLNMTTASLNRI